jgi:Cytochrome C oxidase, cbb3-type, subunit III
MARFWTILIAAGSVIALSLIYLWSGFYNVAATEPHWKATNLVLNLARNRSVAAHSEGIRIPDLSDPVWVEEGFDHYRFTCRLCHAAPGLSSAEFAGGLYPRPPYLPSGEVQAARTKAQLFWVIKHGIKMTGMPSFGPKHDDGHIWKLVAFAEKMGSMSPEAYKELEKKKPPESSAYRDR